MRCICNSMAYIQKLGNMRKKPKRKQAHLLAPTLKADVPQAKEPVF